MAVILYRPLKWLLKSLLAKSGLLSLGIASEPAVAAVKLELPDGIEHLPAITAEIIPTNDDIHKEIKRKLTPILLARQAKLQSLADIRALLNTPLSSLGSSPQPGLGQFEDISLSSTFLADDPRLQASISTPGSNGSNVTISSYEMVNATQSPPPQPWAQIIVHRINDATGYVRSFKFPGF